MKRKQTLNETKQNTLGITCHNPVVARADFAQSPTNKRHAPPPADSSVRPVFPGLTLELAPVLPQGQTGTRRCHG
jgi:hypothetical protein